MTYYLDPAKNTYSYNLSVAHDMCAAEQFATKQAKKDCLTRIQRAYQCLIAKPDRAALAQITGDHWCLVYPLELRHVRKAKHEKLLLAGVGNENTHRVFYLLGERERINAMPVVKPAPKPKAPARTTERQATHVGTCQICGRKHKVDVQSGRIASHGYTKDFGFHNDQCFGSNSMPYETHTDRLEEYKTKLISKLFRSSECKYSPQRAALQDRYLAAIERTEARIAAHTPNMPLTPVEELV